MVVFSVWCADVQYGFLVGAGSRSSGAGLLACLGVAHLLLERGDFVATTQHPDLQRILALLADLEELQRPLGPLERAGGPLDPLARADDDQPATVSRLAPVAARHFRDSGYLVVVERATRVCQNNDRAVAYAVAHALALRELFLGNALLEAFRKAAGEMAKKGPAGAEVAGRINDAIAVKELSVREATLRFGQSCPLEASFPSAIHCALRYSYDFAAALQATAAAGGDSAGRASMVGAWLGASLGIGAVPAQWRERLTARDIIAACTERIVTLTRGDG